MIDFNVESLLQWQCSVQYTYLWLAASDMLGPEVQAEKYRSCLFVRRV